MTTFVDTSALLALLDRDEEHHAEALAWWDELAAREAGLVTTNYVLLETIAVAQHRLGIDAVRSVVRDLLPLFDVTFVDAPVHSLAVASLLAAGRRRLSLVDCTSFEIMRRLGIRRAFAFDRHFDEQGFARG